MIMKTTSFNPQELSELIRKENWFPHFEFVFDAHNIPVMEKLWAYMNNNPDFEKMGREYSLGKGIMLVGNPGVGKDEIMRLMNKWFKLYRPEMTFKWTHVFEAQDVIKTRPYEYFKDINQHDYYFSDIGNPDEEEVRDYGRKFLVTDRIVSHRYIYFCSTTKRITHFTTNHKWSKLSELFADKTMSRLRAMVNFVSVPGDDRRFTTKTTLHREPIIIPDKEHDSVSRETALEMLIEHWKNTGEMPLTYAWDGVLQYLVDHDYITITDEVTELAEKDALAHENVEISLLKSETDKARQRSFWDIDTYRNLSKTKAILRRYFINNFPR